MDLISMTMWGNILQGGMRLQKVLKGGQWRSSLRGPEKSNSPTLGRHLTPDDRVVYWWIQLEGQLTFLSQHPPQLSPVCGAIATMCCPWLRAWYREDVVVKSTLVIGLFQCAPTQPGPLFSWLSSKKFQVPLVNFFLESSLVFKKCFFYGTRHFSLRMWWRFAKGN